MITEADIRAAQSGNSEAFTRIYNETIKTAYYVARRILLDEEATEDVLQEAYIAVYEHLGDYKSGNFQGWVDTIVANRAKNYLRKKNPILFSEMETEENPVVDFEDEKVEFRPDSKADYDETRRLVLEIVDALPPDQRLSTILFYFEEKSVKEIAEICECSENTVKSRLNYARKKIKEDVLALEKKGTKLYSISVIPFLVWMLTEEAEACVVSEVTSGTILTGVEATMGNVATQTAGALAQEVGKEVAKEAAKEVAKEVARETVTQVGMALGTKIAIAVTAAVVAVGGITAGVAIVQQNEERQDTDEWQYGDQIVYSNGNTYNCIDDVYYLDNSDKVTGEMASSMDEYYGYIEEAVKNKEAGITIALDIPHVKEGFLVSGKVEEEPIGWRVYTMSVLADMLPYANYKSVYEATGTKVLWTIEESRNGIGADQYFDIIIEFRYYDSSYELIYATGKEDYLSKVNEALNKGITEFDVCVQIDSSYERPKQELGYGSAYWYEREFGDMRFVSDSIYADTYPDFGAPPIMYAWDRDDAVVIADYATNSDIQGLKIYSGTYAADASGNSNSIKTIEKYDSTVLLHHQAIYLKDYYAGVPVVSSLEEAKAIVTQMTNTEAVGPAFLLKFDESFTKEEREALYQQYFEMMFEVKNDQGNHPGQMSAKWQYRGYMLFRINIYGNY